MTPGTTKPAGGDSSRTPQEATTVRIADLLRGERYQIRAKLDPGTVARYANGYAAGAGLPPVTVAQVGKALVLVDGWHRVAALERLGRGEVGAVVIPATDREARWLAAHANLTHGLPLKNKEIREVFRAYIRARQHLDGRGGTKSYRVIAQDLGGVKAYTTIRNWMQKDFREIAKRMEGDERFTGDGGPGGPGPSAVFTATAGQHLDNALAAFRGIEDPVERGQIIEQMERALEEMKEGGYSRPDF
jgi:hypothetical protein